MRGKMIAATVIAAFAASAVGLAHAAGTSRSIDPANFVRHVTNPYYPLKPGTTLVYKGVRDGQTQVDRVYVTHRTRTIEGVHATVVLVSHEPSVLTCPFGPNFWVASPRYQTLPCLS
jgi:hypothetical protein